MAATATVEKAVNALVKWRDSQSHLQNPQLLEEDEFLYLIVSLKKIPQNRVNPMKVPLPHPLIGPSTDSAELCMFIDDRPKSGITKDAASKKIKSENIPITKLIKLSKLKTDYQPFEAKRKLCDSYNMFFADKRIIPLLPRLLGKQFFKKKKIPVPVDLKHRNWKEQIEKACSSAMLFLGSGTCCVVKVAKLSLGKKEIVENVVAAINGIAEVVPSKWGSIRSFHLKLPESLALPVYQAMPDLRLKIVAADEADNPTPMEEKQQVEDEEDDASNQKTMKKKKNKGRIHEVQYMDDQENIDNSNSGADIKDEIKTDDIPTKKKKKTDMKVKDKKKKKKVAA
ncbi:hypothetical protein GQ457_06G042960 [Hibiscus cannabinus]